MTLEEVSFYEDLSIRSFNVCNDNGLKDLFAILKHYQQYKTFLNLRKCGNKSSDELIVICIKYSQYYGAERSDDVKQEKKIISTVNNLTRTQREIVNSFIETNANNLSNRSKNSISSFLNGNLKIRNISERILGNDRFNFQDLKNVGTLTVTELNSFFDSISDFIEKVSELKNENDLVALRNKFFIEKTFSISIISDEILESQSIFSLVDFLINNDAIFEKNEKIIFQKAFKIYYEQPERTIDDIAEEINISRERVRQIRKGIAENLFNSIQFTRNFNDDLYQKYDIDKNQHLINIEDDLNGLINGVNKTNFSNEFNSFIIYTYFSDKFDLFGEIEDVLLPRYFKSKERHNWENFYLVNKKISRLFSFDDFVNDLDKRLSERIEESYYFNFNSYLLNFSKSTNLDLLFIISKVAEKILNNEFGIHIDTDDNILFARNTLKQGYEYAYEALKLLGKPSKVNEITKKVEELHPYYETNDAKVRASLKRDNGFVPIGRRSVFGLKEWENELENFKGGTIRSIVSEYLKSEVDPKHISEITKYVLDYRPNTYERSILDNLKADDSRKFIFFKNSTIGLKSKKYDNLFVELNQIGSQESKSWHERYNDFAQFVNINSRLPYSSRCPDEEIRLYSWYKIQERKIKMGNLDTEKCKLLNQINIQCNLNETNPRRKSNNAERYIELEQFVYLNNRLPSANKSGEENLYHFFYKQRKLHEQGNLDQFEESKFVEIVTFIQNREYENKRK